MITRNPLEIRCVTCCVIESEIPQQPYVTGALKLQTLGFADKTSLLHVGRDGGGNQCDELDQGCPLFFLFASHVHTPCIPCAWHT